MSKWSSSSVSLCCSWGLDTVTGDSFATCNCFSFFSVFLGPCMALSTTASWLQRKHCFSFHQWTWKRARCENIPSLSLLECPSGQVHRAYHQTPDPGLLVKASSVSSDLLWTPHYRFDSKESQIFNFFSWPWEKTGRSRWQARPFATHFRKTSFLTTASVPDIQASKAHMNGRDFLKKAVALKLWPTAILLGRFPRPFCVKKKKPPST